MSSVLFKMGAVLVASRLFGRLQEALETAGVPLAARIPLYLTLMVTGGIFCLWKWQESILYHPAVPNPQNPLGGQLKNLSDNPAGYRSPSEHGMDFREADIVTEDNVKISAWFIPAKGAGWDRAPTLMFSHENAGNMGLRLPEFKVLHEALGYNLLVYDYRGYGDSGDATIDEAGLMRDAHAAWRWLVERAGVDADAIVLSGRSLGGAVTIQLARDLCEASEKPARALPAAVLVSNTFTSIEDMIPAKFSWLDYQFVRKGLLRMHWRSIDHIQRVCLPLLFIVGMKDEIVPPVHNQMLREAAKRSPRVELRAVPNGMHNDTWIKAGREYVEWVREFVDSAVAARRAELAGSRKDQG
jgi:fermentation-respiration switch protein FrsA (DUF1100 family)